MVFPITGPCGDSGPLPDGPCTIWCLKVKTGNGTRYCHTHQRWLGKARAKQDNNCSHDLGLKPGEVCSRCGEPVGIKEDA